MKEPIKDRIDVLLEKAKNNDSDAQLQLAQCLKEGKWVEVSIEHAKYWAFKSASNGCPGAEKFYKSLYNK